MAKVVVRLNPAGDGKPVPVRTYNHVHGDPQFTPAGTILRNASGGVIAFLPWSSVRLIEAPDNDTSLVSLPAGITSALALSN